METGDMNTLPGVMVEAMDGSAGGKGGMLRLPRSTRMGWRLDDAASLCVVRNDDVEEKGTCGGRVEDMT